MRIGVLTGVIRCLERESAAIVVVAEGAVPEGGVMVALSGTDIIRVKLAEATAAIKTVPPQRHAEAEVFFG